MDTLGLLAVLMVAGGFLAIGCVRAGCWLADHSWLFGMDFIHAPGRWRRMLSRGLRGQLPSQPPPEKTRQRQP